MKAINTTLTIVLMLIITASFGQARSLIIVEPRIGDISFKKHVYEKDFVDQTQLILVDQNGNNLSDYSITRGSLFLDTGDQKAKIEKDGLLSVEALRLLKSSEGKKLHLFYEYVTPDGQTVESSISAHIR